VDPQQPKLSKFTKFKQFLQRNRKKILIATPFVLIIIFAVIVALNQYVFSDKEAGTETVTQKEEATETEEKPTTAPSLINGVMVSPDIANRHPVAAMIENSTAARPQAGLTSADLVYEIVTEGGITRFMGVFSQTYPEKAGPIRSARSYFLDYLSEYDGFYVHAGGSPAALSNIGNYDIKDYPHSNDGTYTRVPQAGVASEHTLFANIAKIFENSTTKKGWPSTMKTNFQSWKFKDPSATPDPSGPIVIDFSSASFKVVWRFDPSTNEYLRELAGVAHKDRETDEQIKAKAVITMNVSHSANAPYAGTGKESEWDMDTIGSGASNVFQDGKQINGTWKKPSRLERTRFYDESGNEIEINRGKIWVEVIPQEGSVTLTPTS
jgi:hypothetical protein